MIVKCHFCMEREPVKRIAGPITKNGPVVFELCEECAAEKEVCDKRGDKILELQHKNASELCVGCGICCFILNARITHAEAANMVEAHGIKMEDFAIETEIGKALYPGDLTIKMPCAFLMGKPLGKWTACQIHGKIRPEVCGSYLCKMAIRYQLGTISLNEARYWLRTAILTKDFSIFNWIKDESDAKILISAAIEGQVSRMKREGLTEDQIQLNLASVITPRYHVKSALDELTLDMHFATHDRGDDDPKVFFTEEELMDFQCRQATKDTVELIVNRVVATFRKYFDRVDRELMKPTEIDEEKADELREEIDVR